MEPCQHVKELFSSLSKDWKQFLFVFGMLTNIEYAAAEKGGAKEDLNEFVVFSR